MSRLRLAAGAALLVGIVALALPASSPRDDSVSWESLLAPYSRGASIPGGFRLSKVARGVANEIVLTVVRDDGKAMVDVHVLERGRWREVLESESFCIGYEVMRTSASAAESRAVTELLAATIRSRDRGLPAPDSIPLGPTPDPTLLPWWLQLLRGTPGMLIGVSLALLGVIMLIPASATATLGLVVGAIDIVVRTSGAAISGVSLGGRWMVPAAALLYVLARRGHPILSSTERGIMLALAGTAWVIRLLLGSWGPLHVNGMGPLWVSGAAADPRAIATYGPGYAELFGPLAALLPESPDWAIFAANALFSAAVPALAFALGRLLGFPPRTALTAALLLALDPIAIAAAATESYFPPIVFLTSAAGVALVAGAHDMDAGGNRRAAACFGAAALLLTEAARIHPVAWGVVATLPFLALAGIGRSTKQRARAFIVAGAILAGMPIALSGNTVLDVLGAIRSGNLVQPPSLPPAYPLIWVAVAAAAYAAISRHRWLALSAALGVALLVMTRHVYWQSWLWQASYDRLYLTIPVLAAASLTVPVRSRWVAAAAAVLVAVAWFRFAPSIIATRTTDQLEYAWVRRQLAALPSECRAIYLAAAGSRAVILPTYVSGGTAVAMNPRLPQTITEALAPGSCIYYIRSSLCSSIEGRPECAALEGRLELTPIAHAAFPAHPSHTSFPYDRDPVESTIAHVERVVP